MGDPKSLVEAKKQLENVGKHFERILEVWIEFAAKLNHLSQNKDDTELLFIGFQENPEGFADQLNESVEDVKVVWQGFMDDCTEYQTKSEREKHQLYGFLTEPVDELSDEERNKRCNAVLEKMQSELEENMTRFSLRNAITL